MLHSGWTNGVKFVGIIRLSLEARMVFSLQWRTRVIETIRFIIAVVMVSIALVARVIMVIEYSLSFFVIYDLSFYVFLRTFGRSNIISSF